VTYSVKNLQERFGVGEATVLGWIQSGELEAIDTRRSGSTRAKWRVTQEALNRFESKRSTMPKTRRMKGGGS